MMAAEFKMRSHLELLKTLEDHVIDSVEIEYRDGQAHVEISGHTGGPDYETLNTKTVSFSIHLKRVWRPWRQTETLEEKVEREADEKYRDEHELNFDGSRIVYPGEEEEKEGS